MTPAEPKLGAGLTLSGQGAILVNGTTTLSAAATINNSGFGALTVGNVLTNGNTLTISGMGCATLINEGSAAPAA